jgi:hypothetical protein
LRELTSPLCIELIFSDPGLRFALITSAITLLLPIALKTSHVAESLNELT